jgi:dienelactone hydrolase
MEGHLARGGGGPWSIVVLHEAYYYDAEHAFMNERLPAHAPPAAALAWARTLGFLRGLATGDAAERPVG